MVFLIGASANNFLHVLKSFANLGGRRGMKHMLKYLTEHPEKRLVRYEMGFPTIVQYWRSFDDLEAFARDQDDPHLEPWRNYWRRVGKSDRTGIRHETFLVRVGEWEAVCRSSPRQTVIHRGGRTCPSRCRRVGRRRRGPGPRGARRCGPA